MKEPRKKKQINVEIGARIKQARMECGITQEQMAELVDVTVQYVSDLERGVTGGSVGTIVKICRTLSVSSDFLLLGKSPDQDLVLSDKLRSFTPEQKEAVLEIIEKVESFSKLPNK